MITHHSILAAMTVWQTIFVIFYVGVGILLVGIILLQKGRGGGIGSAFGGGGGGTSAFGAKTGDVFTWITVVLAGILILTGVAGNYVLEPVAPEGLAVPAVQAAPTGEPGPAGSGPQAPVGSGTATTDAEPKPTETPSTPTDETFTESSPPPVESSPETEDSSS